MFFKYPSTPQLKDVVSELHRKASYGGVDEAGQPIKIHNYTLPTVNFHATVKLHGTNAGVSLHRNGELYVQSRNRELTLGNDNAGFYAYVAKPEHTAVFKDYLQNILNDLPEEFDAVVLYGEWAGENIQPGVAIQQVKKSFFSFDLAFVTNAGKEDQKIEFVEQIELLHEPSINVYSLHKFPTYQFEIDFNSPEQAQNEIVKLVEQVENECPVAKEFGHSGIGEGVVLRATINNQRVIFKAKGEKHSTSKVRTLKDVDLVAKQAIDKLASDLVSERRYEQGIEYLKEMEHPLSERSTGIFINWILEDVKKEEHDVIVQSGHEFKAIQRSISHNARKWFFDYLAKHLT